MLGESGSGWFNDTTESIESMNFSCVARHIQGPVMLPYSPTLTNAIKIAQGVYYVILMICGVVLNTKLIVLVAKYKKLQTLSFVISLQVVAMTMIVRILIVIVGVASMIANQWVFGKHVCNIFGIIVQTCFMVRTFLMFIFVIDRFLSVFAPFFYPKHKVKIATSLSVLSWILSITTALIACGLDCFRFSPVTWTCRLSGTCSKSCTSYTLLLYGAVVLPLVIAPIFFYAILYIKSRRIRNSTATSIENIMDAADSYSSEWRATLTFFLLFVTVFVLTLPNLTVIVIIARLYQGEEVPESVYVVEVVVVCVLGLLVITDPVVIMRNKDIRDKAVQFRVKIVQKCCPSLLTETEAS